MPVAINYQVLGQPGRDNALLATVDTGQSRHRLLFDCGEGCLDGLQRAEVQSIDALFFSHFHIDHVAGFDSFFRANWYRSDPPVQIFGPAGTRRIIHHRMQKFAWNLVDDLPGEVHVTEITSDNLIACRYLASEGFSREHILNTVPFNEKAYCSNEFTVQAKPLWHGITSMAYLVRESAHSNIDMQVLVASGFTPGPWLKHVKETSIPDETEIEVAGNPHTLGDLRASLLSVSPGDSIAYLTDFCLDTDQAADDLIRFLSDCKTLVCENNLRDSDAVLARKSYHMTSSQVGQLAAHVQPEKLIVFHLSDRYTEDDWREQLAEVRGQFKDVQFPTHWDLS